MAADDLAAHEALIAFLYQVPIGLLQATSTGEIMMINPMSAPSRRVTTGAGTALAAPSLFRLRRSTSSR